MTNTNELTAKAQATIGILENIAGYEPGDIDGDTVELRFEDECGCDTGCDVSLVEQCQNAADVIRALTEALEAAEKTSSARLEAIDRSHKMYQRERDRAEAALRANAAQDDHINQQQDRIDQLEKGHNEAAKQIHSWRRLAKQNIAEREKDIAALTDARQRIASLEARTLTVKLPGAWCEPGNRWIQEADTIAAIKAACAAAGIKLQIEGD